MIIQPLSNNCHRSAASLLSLASARSPANFSPSTTLSLIHLFRSYLPHSLSSLVPFSFAAMYSHATDTARTIVGIIGNVISFGLFISPANTFWRIVKNKSVEEFQYLPYIACVMNCLFWVLYGLPIVHPHSTLVVTINGTGLAMEMVYILIYFTYTDSRTRLKVVLWLLVELITIGGIAAVTITCFHTHASRSNFVGIWCVVFGIVMYASPLSAMYNVLTAKSVKYMPFLLSLASFSNGVIWLVYALIEFDLFILICNGIGALLGIMQLILYACYYKSTHQRRLRAAKRRSHYKSRFRSLKLFRSIVAVC